MEKIGVGELVRFRPESILPKTFKFSSGALGKVAAKYVEPGSGRVWIDVNLAPEAGFLFAVDPAEFEAAEAPTRTLLPG
jgi:hypothetical protein